jgi:hypothetical protein
MNLRCRIFGHVFVLRTMPAIDWHWVMCLKCMLYFEICTTCTLLGYTESIGGRHIPCPHAPHIVTIDQDRRTIPRGRMIDHIPGR